MHKPRSFLLLPLILSSAQAATPLISIELIQDDQAGFDLWPSTLSGSQSIANFSTDGTLTSGTTTVTLEASTTFAQLNNRPGSSNGTPPSYSYQNLYEDILIASSPTGALSLSFSGLNAGEVYELTLYAWDPGGPTTDIDRVWEIQSGTATPSSGVVNWSNPLVDNETHSIVFNVTADASGEFSVANTDGLPQSALNGFALAAVPVPEPSSAIFSLLSLLILGRRKRS